MNLVLLLSVTTLLGAVCGDGAHAGNFMASSPCFSFQGQNILWPSGPQGLAGMSTSNPWSVFNHPFFGGGGSQTTGVKGAPVESSLPSEPAEPTPPTAPAPAPVPAPVPVPPIEPAPISVAAAVEPSNKKLPCVPESANDCENYDKDVIKPSASASSAIFAHTDDTHLTPDSSDHTTYQDLDDITHASTTSSNIVKVAEDTHTALELSDPKDDIDRRVIHAVPSTVVPIKSTTVAHGDISASSSESVESRIPATEDKDQAALLSSMPSEPLPVIPGINASHVPPLIDACNISCPTPPVIDHLPGIPNVCHDFPIFDIANLTLPPIVDVCNISHFNTSDLTPISCHNSWNYCDYPGIHPIPYHDCHPHSYDPCFVDHHHHEIYPHPIAEQPYVLSDHIHHHTLHNHCFDYPGYETNVLPPISYFNISNPNELNLTDIESSLPPTAKIIKNPSELQCTRHNIVTECKPVIDECITCIPVIKNRIRQKEETFTHNIPILTNHISTREEKRLCHIPIVNQHTHNVIEHAHDHLPLTQSRLVHIVQPYVDQVPIVRPYVRPVVEESLSHVPVVESCIKPIIHHRVSSIPVTERRIIPTLHQEIADVPIGGTAPSYEGYCETPQIQHHYASDSLPVGASTRHLNYPDLPNQYISEGSVDHYGAASNPVPSFSYDKQDVGYGGEVTHEPEYEETLNNFRRNLYLPSGTASSQEDGYSPYQEASLPAAPEEYPGDKTVGGERYIDTSGSIGVEPVPEQQELPQETSENVPDQYSRQYDYCD